MDLAEMGEGGQFLKKEGTQRLISRIDSGMGIFGA